MNWFTSFPSGPLKELRDLKAGHERALELAVKFLEADPWFHGSGYLKADLIKRVVQAKLSEDQRKRLQKVVLARIEGRDAREFRSYCRLAVAVVDEEFGKEVVQLLLSPEPRIRRHAKWVLIKLLGVISETGAEELSEELRS